MACLDIINLHITDIKDLYDCSKPFSIECVAVNNLLEVFREKMQEQQSTDI